MNHNLDVQQKHVNIERSLLHVMSLMALYLIRNLIINCSCSIPTFAEKLRRKDAEVAKALEEKERLIADILHIPPPLSSTSLDVYGRASSSGDIENPFDDPSGALDIQHQMSDKDATKVLLAALEQGKKTNHIS